MVTGQHVNELYNYFETVQWWDRERLIKVQNDNLKETIISAYHNSSLYKDLFDKEKIKSADIKTVADLQKIPVVTKDMLREYYPDSTSIKPRQKVTSFHTSGSTGKPFQVFLDERSISLSRALMLHRATYSGWEVGDRYLQTGMTLQRGLVKKIKDNLLRVIYVSAFDLSDSTLDQYLQILDDKKCRYIMGYASSLYLLASRAKEMGFNCIVHGLVSWGDNMYPHYRKMIEDVFRCNVTDTYGCGEGIQVSAQCSEADGSYHVFMPHVAVEYVDDGVPVPKGELGEILLTRLNPGAMPLIRYKVGDVGREDIKESCSCGRGFKLMKSIEGRASDIVVTPNGNKLIVHFFTGIFEYAKHIETFQVIQKKKEEILVRIVPKGEFDEKEWRLLEAEIKEKGDMDLLVQLEVVDDIPLESSNKRRFVISRL
jgi:phenylacetate-CoA ligase